MKKIFLIGLILAVAVVVSGCASYTVQSMPSQLDENKVVKAEKEDISVTAFPILTEEDSKRYFDKNLIGKNILAVYFVIVNYDKKNVQFISSDLVLGGGKIINPYPQKEVYKTIRREYGGKAFLWMFPTWFVGAPVSVVHTASVNTKIEEDINKKHLNFGEIKPREFAQGFLWFKLPDDAALEERGDRKLALKMIFKKDGELVEHNLSIKPPR